MGLGLKQLKLGAKFKFSGSGAAVSSINKVNNSFVRLHKTTLKTRSGLAKVGQSLAIIARTATFTFAPALLLGAKVFMDFEKTMSGVAAVSFDMTKKQFLALSESAQDMGLKTVFSAKNIAKGMEQLARAGFQVTKHKNEIMDAIGGVTDLAAAEGTSVENSAKIMSNVLRGMSLMPKEATRVANVLALASTKAQIDMTLLGESFAYASATARPMGIDLENTAAALTLISRSGTIGSRAGTAFSNMFRKLSNQNQAGAKFLKKYNISLTEFNKETQKSEVRSIGDIIQDVNDQLEKSVPDVLKRQKLIADLFSERGKRAFNAIVAAGDGTAGSISKKFKELVGELKETTDAAAVMARKRLDNVWGALILFKSSMEGLAISVYDKFKVTLKKSLQGVTNFVNAIVMTMRGRESELAKFMENVAGSKMMVTMGVAIGRGIKGFLDKLKKWTGRFAKGIVEPFIKWFDTLSKKTQEWVGFLALAIPIIGGIVGPLIFIATLLLPSFYAGGVMIVGMLTAVAGLLSPIGEVLLGIYVIFKLLQSQTNSGGFLATLGVVWEMISGIFSAFYNGVMVLAPVFGIASEWFKVAVAGIGMLGDTLAAAFGGGGRIRTVMHIIGILVGGVVGAGAAILGVLANVWVGIMITLAKIFEGIAMIGQRAAWLWENMGTISDNVSKWFKNIGSKIEAVVHNYILRPILSAFVILANNSVIKKIFSKLGMDISSFANNSKIDGIVDKEKDAVEEKYKKLTKFISNQERALTKGGKKVVKENFFTKLGESITEEMDKAKKSIEDAKDASKGGPDSKQKMSDEIKNNAELILKSRMSIEALRTIPNINIAMEPENREVNVHSDIHIDGEKIGTSVSNVMVEIGKRLGKPTDFIQSAAEYLSNP